MYIECCKACRPSITIGSFYKTNNIRGDIPADKTFDYQKHADEALDGSVHSILVIEQCQL